MCVGNSRRRKGLDMRSGQEIMNLTVRPDSHFAQPFRFLQGDEPAGEPVACRKDLRRIAELLGLNASGFYGLAEMVGLTDRMAKNILAGIEDGLVVAEQLAALETPQAG